MINPEDMNVEGMERERTPLESKLQYEAHVHDVEQREIQRARIKAEKEMILNRADFQDYMPPIISMVNQFTDKLVEYREGCIMAQINETVQVDKQELIKALEYDRGQFEAGYKSAMKHTIELIDAMYDAGELGTTQYLHIIRRLERKEGEKDGE